MKKILSLIMALTLVMGVNAAFKPLNKKALKNAPRLEQVQKQAIHKAPMAATVTFEPADFAGQGTEGTGSAVSVTKDGVTVSTDKGFGHNNYTTSLPDQLRVYSGGTLTIEASATITKIEFTFEDSKDGFLETSYTPNSTSWSETLSAQARISLIVITLDGDTPTPPTPPTPVGDTTALTSLDGFEFAYYPSYSEEGAYNYSLYIYDSESEDYVPQLALDIYTEEKDVVTGNFSVKGGNLGLDYSAFYLDADSEGEALTDASVKVTEGEGDNLILEGIFTTEAGKTYSFSVSGESYIYDAEHPYEPQTVTSFNLTATQVDVDNSYVADYGELDYYMYMEDDSFVALAYYTENTTLKGLADGIYNIFDDYEAFATGLDYAGLATLGSYYQTVEGDVYYFVSGTVTFATSNGTTTITVDAVSAYGSTIKVTGTIGETPGPGPSSDHTIVIADYADVNFTTLDGAYTVASAQNGGQNPPKYNDTSEDLRLYAKNTMTLTKNTKNGPMTKIVFNISDKGLMRQAEITPSVGTMAYDMTNAMVTWTGEASEVVFTVGDKADYGTDGATKAGQFDFTSIDIEGGSYSALDNVKAVKAVKTLVKGQVIIERNGRQYNMLGF